MPKRLILSVIASIGVCCASVLLAQHQVGPVYPEKPQPYTAAPPGYDPFQLDWSTGRFRYVPIPYDQRSSTGPYRFNWYSGRWDYSPFPAPASPMPAPTNTPERTPQASMSVVRIPQYNAPVPVIPGEAMPAAARQLPTNATTRPTRTRAPTTDPLHLNPSLGRWEQDSNTGRWIHVLPSDCRAITCDRPGRPGSG